MPAPQSLPIEPDWAAFYRSFEKPGYVAGFEIGNKLGGGVFGVVYKARRESIGKAYAIKFLKVEDPGVRQQVLAELDSVSLFAQVDHPNLVSIEDKGVVDGIPYIVMGYAGDETLRSRLEHSRLGDEETLQLFVQVCRGVQALHDHSLVHFDLKPGNVFLKGDVARVGDYGLSKLMTETAMSLTSGRGTPYYMAPEMLRRRGDHRSDIYSLGVILYECLIGAVPFTGDSEWEVLKGHEEKPVAFPKELAPRFRKLLQRMLAKEPEKRVQSVKEVLAELRVPSVPGASIRLTQTPPAADKPAVAAREKPRARIFREPQREWLLFGLGRVIRTWWPYLLILAGIWIVINQVAFPRFYDRKIAMAICFQITAVMILCGRLVRWVFQPESARQLRDRRHWLLKWLPWILLVGGHFMWIFEAFGYRNIGLAWMVNLFTVGTLALLWRGVRVLSEKRRRRVEA